MKKGYLWIATESGLNRFDGRQFNIYTKNNSGLSGNELNVVLADPYVKQSLDRHTTRWTLLILIMKQKPYHAFLPRAIICSVMISQTYLLLPTAAYGSHIIISELITMIGKPNCLPPYSSKNVKGLEGNNWVSKEDGNGNLYIGHHLRGLSIVSLKDRTAKNLSA